MNIYLALDLKCLSNDKINKEKLGGTERSFLLIKKYLESKGHEVTFDPLLVDDMIYDIAIHSNFKNLDVVADKHICRAGSYTTDAQTQDYDVIITLSNFFAKFINRDNVVVIPVCYDSSLSKHKSALYEDKKIMTTSNPNRHLKDTLKVIKILDKEKVDYTWEICGGNKLYSNLFPEVFKAPANPKVLYSGILSHTVMLKKLALSHLFCYPNFSDESETFCVAMVEAAALGLPVILPKREPFTEVLPDNPYFCKNIKEMASTIKELLTVDRSQLYVCDVSRFTEDVVMAQIGDAIGINTLTSEDIKILKEMLLLRNNL